MKYIFISALVFFAATSCNQSSKTAGTATTAAEEDKNYFDRAISQEKLTMVDFYTTWCKPCKLMAPYIEKITDERVKDVTVLSIDAEKESSISSRYALEGYPTLIFFKNGKEIHRELGMKSLEELNALVDRLK